MSKYEQGTQTIYTYQGVAYKQNSDTQTPWIVSFVASAEEIREWASIPRRGKSEDGQIGFQRINDESRVEQAASFFKKSPLNQSPTAIILGIHPNHDEPIAELIFENQVNSGNIRNCKLKIRVPKNLTRLEDILVIKNLVRDKLSYRLQGSNLEEDNEDDLIFEDDSELIDVDIEDEQSHQELELGTSLVQTLLYNLDNDDWCAKNLETLREFSKPATIIDGQHRLLGAASREQNIPFTVCALFDCPWTEQVFQFTVVNYTAKGIPDQFITANAALSLTKSELNSLKSRFEQANVKVLEYDLMEVVNFNRRSPFYDLVNLSEKSVPNKIGYKTMVRVAKQWYNAKHFNFMRLIFPNLKFDSSFSSSLSKKRQLEVWREKYWEDFFIDFWNTIYDKYANCPSDQNDFTLWDVGHSNLMLAIVLLDFQDSILSNLGALVDYLESNNSQELRSKFCKLIKGTLEYFPPDFFGTTWKLKSINSGRREALKSALTSMAQTGGAYQYTKSSLITGKIKS